ncbi:MAG: GIY-YIG nuclease family protein [Gammaproteobacteria bacterium]|nr:GIY-YIG nuclease family protein [Gammaproteobacteria bacterium]MBL7000056.1 GIY-YIG nuclease family protein [Gammaproteobacteria bacterium]
MNWAVYILRCSDDSLYTGITTDVERRVEEHNGNSNKCGARFTRSRQPVTLVYREAANNRSEASKREMAIKALSRDQKLALIDQSSALI